MAATFSVFHALVKNRNEIIHTRAFNNQQILNKKSVFGIPSCVKDSWLRV